MGAEPCVGKAGEQDYDFTGRYLTHGGARGSNGIGRQGEGGEEGE